MRTTLLTCLLLLSESTVHAAEFTVTRGLHFSDAVPKLTLDLYMPTGAKEPVPCIVVIQGGGFAPQDGQRFKPLAERLAGAGFAAALISYRGRPLHHYQDTLADVKASVRYLRHVGPDMGIDTTCFGAMGGSAGGTLAAMLAVTGGEDDLSSRIQAAVCFAGVYDFIGRFKDDRQIVLQPMHVDKLETNSEWIGEPLSSDGQHWRAASAINHIDANDPPILLLHSRDDQIVPWLQSETMHRALKRAGAPSELRIYETGGHAVKPVGHDSFEDMVAFFRRYLQ